MSNVFADLRAKYFVLSRTDVSIPPPKSATEPWGVVMEIGYPQAVVTTVTFADGTVSVFRSSGGGFFGGGDQGVQSAGQGLLGEARRCQPQMTLTAAFPAPSVGQVVFYARADTGVYQGSATEAAVRDQNHPLFRLYCSGLRVLNEYLRLQKQQT